MKQTHCFRIFICICLLAFLSFSSTIFAQNGTWTQFHGSNQDNKSSETGLIPFASEEYDAESLPLLWQTNELGTSEGGSGYSGIVTDGKYIFTTSNVKTGDKVDAVLYALDMNGKILWTSATESAWTGHYPGDRSTPTIDGDYVYHLSAGGDLRCLTIKDGKIIWKKNIRAEYDAELPVWAYADSPVIEGNLVICAPGGKKASVVAFNKMTGKEVWTTPSINEKAGYATPYPFDFNNQRVVAVMTQSSVIGVDAKNGTLLFQAEHPTKYDINATMPYFEDNSLVISSGYESGTELLDLSVDGNKIAVKQRWYNKNLKNQHDGLMFVDGVIYGSDQSGAWIAVDWKTGETLARDRKIGKASCTYADGLIFAYSDRGKVSVFEPNPEKFNVLYSFQLPEGGSGSYWAHPVICGKRLYLRHAERIFCYDLSAK